MAENKAKLISAMRYRVISSAEERKSKAYSDVRYTDFRQLMADAYRELQSHVGVKLLSLDIAREDRWIKEEA